MLTVLFAQPVRAVDWETSEGTLIRNGEAAETIPQQVGEVSLEYTNKVGGSTEYVNSGLSQTEVTHLSRGKFDTEVSRTLYVSPGDSVTWSNGLWNQGNGPDTYSIRQQGALVDGWDTAVYLDGNENGVVDSADTEITDLAEISHVVSLDTQQLVLVVTVPAANTSQRDTFTAYSRSLRTEDPEPGEDTTHMVVQADTSGVLAYNPDPLAGFVDTTAITHDTSIELKLPTLESVDQLNVEYSDSNGVVTQTGFHNYTSADSAWTLTDLEGPHKFKVQYKYENGETSDTYSDEIFLDQTEPQVPNVLIDDGAETTGEYSVKLDVYAEDSRPKFVHVSNYADFSDSETYDFNSKAGTETIDTWTVTASGTVYVKFTDQAGQVSAETSDTIVVDVPPITMDNDLYRGLDARPEVVVTDATKIGAGSVEVKVVSERDTPTGITVELQEDPKNKGSFKGTFGFTQGQSREDLISVDPGNEVTVIYQPRSQSDTCIWELSTKYQDTIEHVRTWPSPFQPTSGEPFVFQKLPADDGMEIFLYNVNGQLVRKLTVGRGIEFNPNGNVARWWGKNDEGSRVASGTYIYVVKSKYGVKRGKVTLVK